MLVGLFTAADALREKTSRDAESWVFAVGAVSDPNACYFFLFELTFALPVCLAWQ